MAFNITELIAQVTTRLTAQVTLAAKHIPLLNTDILPNLVTKKDRVLEVNLGGASSYTLNYTDLERIDVTAGVTSNVIFTVSNVTNGDTVYLTVVKSPIRAISFANATDITSNSAQVNAEGGTFTYRITNKKNILYAECLSLLEPVTTAAEFTNVNKYNYLTLDSIFQNIEEFSEYFSNGFNSNAQPSGRVLLRNIEGAGIPRSETDFGIEGANSWTIPTSGITLNCTGFSQFKAEFRSIDFTLNILIRIRIAVDSTGIEADKFIIEYRDLYPDSGAVTSARITGIGTAFITPESNYNADGVINPRDVYTVGYELKGNPGDYTRQIKFWFKDGESFRYKNDLYRENENTDYGVIPTLNYYNYITASISGVTEEYADVTKRNTHARNNTTGNFIVFGMIRGFTGVA